MTSSPVGVVQRRLPEPKQSTVREVPSETSIIVPLTRDSLSIRIPAEREGKCKCVCICSEIINNGVQCVLNV